MKKLVFWIKKEHNCKPEGLNKMANKKSGLEKYKLKYEDSARKFRLSPTFGQKQPWVVRGWDAIVGAFAYFFYNVFLAIKIIIKEVM